LYGKVQGHQPTCVSLSQTFVKICQNFKIWQIFVWKSTRAASLRFPVANFVSKKKKSIVLLLSTREANLRFLVAIYFCVKKKFRKRKKIRRRKIRRKKKTGKKKKNTCDERSAAAVEE